MNNLKKGFTLIEMIVVIFIIAVLLLLAIPNIQRVIKMVDTKGCETQVKVVDTAILEYMIIHERTPTTLDELVAEHLLSDAQRKCKNGKVISINNGQAVAH